MSYDPIDAMYEQRWMDTLHTEKIVDAGTAYFERRTLGIALNCKQL